MKNAGYKSNSERLGALLHMLKYAGIAAGMIAVLCLMKAFELI